MSHLARYSQIISVFIRYGLGYWVVEQIPLPLPGFGGPNRNYTEAELALIGARLRGALTELGPTFIKMGQLASTRSDILPQPLVKELTKLQDQVRPFSFLEVQQVIENSLQQRMNLVFREFDPKPLAAASIGQVHQAILNSGEKVAVKVQRPRIREVAQIDLEIFGTLVAQFEQKTEWEKLYPIRTLYNEFSKTLLEELDFTNEGRNMETLAQVKKRSAFIIPKVYWEFSHSNVLTQEFIPGIPLYQIITDLSRPKTPTAEKLEYNHSLIAKHLSQGLLQQILRDGKFHGDPHPGNILILPQGEIALIDFGIFGTLTDQNRSELTAIVAALIRGKDQKLLDILSRIGIVPENIDQTQFLQDISALRTKHLKRDLKKIEMGVAIQDFFYLINRHGIYIPSQFILVGKCILTLEGILVQLDPGLSLVELLKPYSRKFLWKK
ncbi:AarF/UbiB family protein [Desulfitobacterium sp. THU1]|uniref:ABC1 kinase family protein n=1 Tax=Desulfitobacterium sp. THU1 TaxID=3138072 RepID=UPI0031201A58